MVENMTDEEIGFRNKEFNVMVEWAKSKDINFKEKGNSVLPAGEKVLYGVIFWNWDWLRDNGLVDEFKQKLEEINSSI